MHTKSILIDDRLSLIGSFNWDMRSAYLNTETVLAIDCEKINEELKAQVRSYAASGVLTRRNPDGGYEFLYGENYAGGRVPIMKSLVYSALRIVILPVRHLL